MENRDRCEYMRPAVYTIGVLIGVIGLVALFGGFDPVAVAAR